MLLIIKFCQHKLIKHIHSPLADSASAQPQWARSSDLVIFILTIGREDVFLHPKKVLFTEVQTKLKAELI